MRTNAKTEVASYLKRQPRIALRCPAVLVEDDGCTLDVVITDVSRDGFKLESYAQLEVVPPQELKEIFANDHRK